MSAKESVNNIHSLAIAVTVNNKPTKQNGILDQTDCDGMSDTLSNDRAGRPDTLSNRDPGCKRPAALSNNDPGRERPEALLNESRWVNRSSPEL